MASNTEAQEMSFWDHLDVLRHCLLRILAATAVAAIAAFAFKQQLFDIVLAPSRSDFWLYRALDSELFHIQLINTALTEQFMVHMKVAALAGLMAASPYILYVLIGFVSPALYQSERRPALVLTLCAYVMFVVGLLVSYLLLFPLTVRFLGTYQVSPDVVPMLSLDSYINTLASLSLVMGLVFEMPVLSFLLARMGLLRAQWMSAVRRHAIIAILIAAAVITPTSDVFTLLMVSLPIYLLYEASIGIVRIAARKTTEDIK